ncbi:MAG: T9SS type A sorting domain-containing protein, partial [Chlorobi bacterium]|nr:T9SS type A sorting domain-containing protein [Chlorobiota bacterium]
YPNPVTDKFYISGTSNFKYAEIFDISGKQIKIISEKKQYDISDFPSGIYFLKIYSSDKTFVKKIIKK